MPTKSSRLFIALLVALTFLLVPPVALAKGSKGSGGGKTVHVKSYTKKDGTKVAAHDRKAPDTEKSSAKKESAKKESTVKPSTGVARDAKGRIKRSEEAKHQFEVQTGYLHGRPGYVVDHIKPLACGGADAPSNMQWQSVADAKAKDKVERVGCR